MSMMESYMKFQAWIHVRSITVYENILFHKHQHLQDQDLTITIRKMRFSLVWQKRAQLLIVIAGGAWTKARDFSLQVGHHIYYSKNLSCDSSPQKNIVCVVLHTKRLYMEIAWQTCILIIVIWVCQKFVSDWKFQSVALAESEIYDQISYSFSLTSQNPNAVETDKVCCNKWKLQKYKQKLKKKSWVGSIQS